MVTSVAGLPQSALKSKLLPANPPGAPELGLHLRARGAEGLQAQAVSAFMAQIHICKEQSGCCEANEF